MAFKEEKIQVEVDELKQPIVPKWRSLCGCCCQALLYAARLGNIRTIAYGRLRQRTETIANRYCAQVTNKFLLI